MKKGPYKIRIDRLLVDRGIAKDIKEAQSLIMVGHILVDNEVIRKPDQIVDSNSKLNIKSRRYVSRGGEKLEGALIDFQIDVKSFVCADIGISTGGFTDCLLKKGAFRVYGFDVGYGILDYSLRNDNRVILFERCNFKNFDVTTIKEKMDLIVMDLSFISVKRVIPNAIRMLKDGGLLLILIKPQFEAPKGLVKKGGIVVDMDAINAVLKNIEEFITSLRLKVLGIRPSWIKGRKGNQEYFLLARKD